MRSLKIAEFLRDHSELGLSGAPWGWPPTAPAVGTGLWFFAVLLIREKLIAKLGLTACKQSRLWAHSEPTTGPNQRNAIPQIEVEYLLDHSWKHRTSKRFLWGQ
jgi:hypothetical protein